MNLFDCTVTICTLLLLSVGSKQDLQTGVDLVTRLSNELVQPIFQELSLPDENLVVGPFGVSSNIAMLMEASNGRTRQEILHAFNIPSKRIEDLRNGFKAYCELFLEHSSQSEAAGSFNSVGVRSSVKLHKDYKNILVKYYCANSSNIAEDSPETANLEYISDAGVMSHWRDYEKLAVYTFLSHQSLMPFYRRNNATVHVPMIPQVGIFRSGLWENAEVVLLPLQAKLVHLLIVVPNNIDEIDEMINKLTAARLPHLIEALPNHELEVFIPQMTAINKHLDMKSVLNKKGILQAFDANKSNLSRGFEGPDKLFLQQIKQDSYFSTSFVAINSVSGASSSLDHKRRSRRETKKLYVDRPFLFFLLQKDTQLILLAGKIEKPIQTNKVILGSKKMNMFPRL